MIHCAEMSKRVYHCAACMDALGLGYSSASEWKESVCCMACGEIKLCAVGFKKIIDVSALFDVKKDEVHWFGDDVYVDHHGKITDTVVVQVEYR